jgi:hypothetical protein
MACIAWSGRANVSTLSPRKMPSKKNKTQEQHSEPKSIRIPRTIGLRPEQDQWLTDLLGEGGNLSGFMQALVDAARNGKVDTREIISHSQKERGPLDRAVAYLKAKEASMLFEEDVGAVLIKHTNRGKRVTRSRIHNGAGSLFIADYSIEDEKGEPFCSVVCKSSSRADRLQLALAEAMIGTQKTGKPVITVVPYFIDDEASKEVVGQFKMLGHLVTDLKGLPDAVSRATRSS